MAGVVDGAAVSIDFAGARVDQLDSSRSISSGRAGALPDHRTGTRADSPDDAARRRVGLQPHRGDAAGASFRYRPGIHFLERANANA